MKLESDKPFFTVADYVYQSMYHNDSGPDVNNKRQYYLIFFYNTESVIIIYFIRIFGSTVGRPNITGR